MLKQIIALIALSLGIIFTMSYAQQAVQFLVSAHDWISQALTSIFAGDQAGNLAKNFIALLCIPVLIGLIPAFVYWMVKRHWFPYFMQIVWVVWLVQAGALVMMYQAG
jgi:hypothetical protein